MLSKNKTSATFPDSAYWLNPLHTQRLEEKLVKRCSVSTDVFQFLTKETPLKLLRNFHLTAWEKVWNLCQELAGLPVVLHWSVQKRMWPTPKWRQQLWSLSHWTSTPSSLLLSEHQFPLKRRRKRKVKQRKTVHISRKREKRKERAAEHAWTRHRQTGVTLALNPTLRSH